MSALILYFAPVLPFLEKNIFLPGNAQDIMHSVTDLCRWPGWGGAAAAPWRSPRAAPQLAGLGGGRRGQCGPGPSVGVTPARRPFPDPSHSPVPPVWETTAPRCPRRWEEPLGMSRACQCPDLEKQRRRRGPKVSDCISRASRSQGDVTWPERDGYKGKKQLDTGMKGSWAGKTKFLVSPVMLLVEGK